MTGFSTDFPPATAYVESLGASDASFAENEQLQMVLGLFAAAVVALQLQRGRPSSLVVADEPVRFCPPSLTAPPRWSRTTASESFPEPINGVMSINQEEKWRWIAAHDEKYHAALHKLFTTITIVPHVRFVEALGVCVKRVADRISTDRAILVEQNKSNLWAAQLAKKYHGFDGLRMPLGSKDARAVCASGGPLDSIKDRSLWPSAFVLFDDGSYSGQQITEHVSHLACHLERNASKESRIVVIIPFMTHIARGKLEALRQEYREKHGKVTINLAPYHLMPTLVECMEKDPDLHPLRELYGEGGYAHPEHFTEPTGIALHLFDHKVPNALSFPEPLAKASVYPPSLKWKDIGRFIPDVIPPYKAA